jgi:sugar phosphate isomerase/epimerase
VILCSGTLGSQLPLLEKAAAAARAGFDAISVYTREYEPGLASRLGELGLGVAEVDGATAWLPGQPGIAFERAVEIAAECRARSVTVLETLGQAPDPAMAAEHFARACELAAPAGVDVDIEPFAWSGIATVAAAAQIVRLAGCANGGITLDSWHLVRGPERGKLDPAHADLVHALQLSDPAPESERGPLGLRDECMSDRRLPGAWSAHIVRALPGVPLEVEVFNLAGTPDEVAAACYQALQGVANRLPETEEDQHGR